MSDWIQRIKEAKELLEIGAITASEFENIKNTLLKENLRGQKPQVSGKSESITAPFKLSFEINSFKHLKKKAKGISFKRKSSSSEGKALIKIEPLSELDALTVFYWSPNQHHMIQVDIVDNISMDQTITHKLNISQENPGQYEVLFGIQARLKSGQVRCFKNTFGVEILIPEPGMTDSGGSVFIDGSPISNKDVTFVGSAQDHLQNERWLTAEFSPVPTKEFEDWIKSKNCSEHHTPNFEFLQEVSRSYGFPAEIADVLYGNPCTKFEIVNSVNQQQKIIRVLMQPRATFGRAFGRGTESLDVKLMLEPILDWSINPFKQFSDENANLSLKISGKHFEIVLNEEGASICDLDSSNGTLVNGSRLKRERPLAITAPIDVTIGEVLELKLTPLQDLNEEIDGVWIDRVNNLQEQSYAIVRGTIGLWPDTVNILGNGYRSGIRAPIVLGLGKDNVPVLHNISNETCIVNRHVVGTGEAIALRGSTIEVEYDTDRSIVLKAL